MIRLIWFFLEHCTLYRISSRRRALTALKLSKLVKVIKHPITDKEQ